MIEQLEDQKKVLKREMEILRDDFGIQKRELEELRRVKEDISKRADSEMTSRHGIYIVCPFKSEFSL